MSILKKKIKEKRINVDKCNIRLGNLESYTKRGNVENGYGSIELEVCSAHSKKKSGRI